MPSGGNEGDLAPRPNGDGEFRANDLAALQLFFSGAPFAPGGNEFQRADGAPYETQGNGQLNAADVQLMRNYIARLAVPQAAGGPTAPIVLPPFSDESDAPGEWTSRTLRVVSAKASPGGTVTAAIQMDSLGDETVASFTINFDPGALSDPIVSLGSGVSADTILITNMTNAAAGEIGVLVDSNGGFNMSDNQMLTVSFDVAKGTAEAATPIWISGSLIDADVSDINARSLKTRFEAGHVLISRADPLDMPLRYPHFGPQARAPIFGPRRETTAQARTLVSKGGTLKPRGTWIPSPPSSGWMFRPY